MFKNILVAVDGSKYSINAAQKAVAIAQKYGSRITVLHVVNHSRLFSIGPPQAMPMISEAMIEGLNHGGEIILKNTLKALNPMTVTVETELSWGNPAEMILDKAQSKPYDLIVIGNRGLNTISRLFMGSVSERVAKMSTCPVLIVKA